MAMIAIVHSEYFLYNSRLNYSRVAHDNIIRGNLINVRPARHCGVRSDVSSIPVRPRRFQKPATSIRQHAEKEFRKEIFSCCRNQRRILKACSFPYCSSGTLSCLVRHGTASRQLLRCKGSNSENGKPGLDADPDSSQGQELLQVQSGASSTSEPLSGNASGDQGSEARNDVYGLGPVSEKKKEASDLKTLWRRFISVAAPYWSSEDKWAARLQLGVVFALTLATTGISVGFNFLGRDFYNALSSKDEEAFTRQLLYYLGAFVGGIPVFVLRDFYRDTLALRWRAWMTNHYIERYFAARTFYNIQSQSLIDNPDQRLVDDLAAFCGTALSFSLAIFNASIDLISFSGILFSIYPPLFGVLIVYSLGGTLISVALGKGLVGLNFTQEKREADFRYGLVRVRENAESIAFYGGEASETRLLLHRFKRSFQNYTSLLISQRNLDFFTSGYRYLIQLLPAAVVAPLYFAGRIEFGVINQSFSAFNHVLGDVSLVVFQFESLSAFSAVIDRLGEFSDVLDGQNAYAAQAAAQSTATQAAAQSAAAQAVPTERPLISSRPSISLIDIPFPSDERLPRGSGDESASPLLLLQIDDLCLYTPQYSSPLVEDLNLTVCQGENLLIAGASGSGKTSLLRAIAGLWRSGSGTIRRFVAAPIDAPPEEAAKGNGSLKGPDDGQLSGTESPKAAATPGDTNAAGASSSEQLPAGTSPENLFFVPQRPYMVLGTLRQQMLYPTWSNDMETGGPAESDDEGEERHIKGFPVTSAAVEGGVGVRATVPSRSQPHDGELMHMLELVRLRHLAAREGGLDASVEWASVLSLGEQQRLAFARLLLARPQLALMDESTSALDEDNEAHLYTLVKEAGITFISVGHRSSLRQFHNRSLRLEEPVAAEKGRTWNISALDMPGGTGAKVPLGTTRD